MAQMRASWMLALQYRAGFVGEAFGAIFWIGWGVLPLIAVFERRPEVAGWTADEALIVVGFFAALQGIVEGFIDPNLRAVVELVRQGTLDFVLLKPVDAQLLVSFHRSTPTKLPHVVTGLALAGWASSRLPDPPGVLEVAAALLLLLCATSILYGLYTMVVSTAFWFVRVDNLSYLLLSILDTGRWPLSFYRGAVRFVLTFVVPIGLMTTYPALALRGQMDAPGIGRVLAVAVAFFVASRLVWRIAIRRYASASS